MYKYKNKLKWKEAKPFECNSIPEKHGVYMIKDTGNNMVYYIGSSNNLKRRINSHEKSKYLLDNTNFKDKLVVLYAITLKFKLTEKYLISLLNPLLNVSRNGFLTINSQKYWRMVLKINYTIRDSGYKLSLLGERLGIESLQDKLRHNKILTDADVEKINSFFKTNYKIYRSHKNADFGLPFNS